MCSLRCTVNCGIILAVIDVLYGMVTSSFYCYQLVMDKFFLCPMDMPPEYCHHKIYTYNHIFGLRVYIGIGEGIAGILFDLLYIIALTKRKPSLTWVWLLKAFGVLGINTYYMCFWLVRQGSYLHINPDQTTDEFIFFHTTQGLILVQVIILLLFCIISGSFTYKVTEERTASRRKLGHHHPYSTGTSSPSLDNDEDDEGHYVNDRLTVSSKTLPHSSKQSLSDLSRADTFKHSAGV